MTAVYLKTSLEKYKSMLAPKDVSEQGRGREGGKELSREERNCGQAVRGRHRGCKFNRSEACWAAP